MNVAEEMPLGFCLQDEVQNARRTQVIVQDAVRGSVCNQYVDIVGEVFTSTNDNIRILWHL